MSLDIIIHIHSLKLPLTSELISVLFDYFFDHYICSHSIFEMAIDQKTDIELVLAITC